MKFHSFQKTKTLSIANYLSLSNKELAKKLSECEYRYISCINDSFLDDENFIKCEIGSISYVLALICKYKGVKNEYFNDLDEGYLSGECSVGEEEFEELNEWLSDAKQIIIDSSFFTHKDSKNIMKFLEILNMNVVVADENIQQIQTDYELSELDELDVYDGAVIYQVKSDKRYIKGGVSFATVAKVKDGDKIVLEGDGFSYLGIFKLDVNTHSTIAFVGVGKKSGYDFKLVKVSKA
ncbi:hypothetical protein [Campylobacter majalis]|uniref:hypothetical protein n=1 Tax=Campylobacter majalis TaxID=2790656 RepID=UPI003D6859BF